MSAGYFFLTLCLIWVTSVLYGQQNDADSSIQKKPSGKHYTLKGFRHGVSYFPEVQLPGVEYEAGDTLTFDVYHTLDVINTWLHRWADRYPELVDLYQTGLSYEGRPIFQITVTNKATGKDTDKPAAFFEGGRHSGEVTGSESVMWLAQYLLSNYNKDPDIRSLLDARTIYLRPVNNPDGHNLYLMTAQSNRSTVRPYDNDNDGLLDEDPPEDLNGDGKIMTMRWKDSKKGNMITDPADSSGRLTKRVPPGEGIYLTATEGIDNDNDGRINEDGIGGLDLHRNYPENWRPSHEATGRGYTQNGAGEFPLSENETWAVVEFLLTHPNIYVVNSMDTSVPMHLRPPSTSPSEERMFPEDLAWYRIFDEAGKKITGYERAGDVYNDYGSGNPLFGHGPDFGYWYYGAIWYGDEIWNGGRFKDFNNDGKKDQFDMLIWDDTENNGEGFMEWKRWQHPVYGEIELGGFDPKFFSQNPPPAFLRLWAANQALFNLEMAKALPLLEWENIEIKELKSYKTDSADYQIKVSFRNKGRLPTALRQAWLVKIVKEDMVTLDFDTAGFPKGKPFFRDISKKQKDETREEDSRYRDAAEQTAGSSVTEKVPFTAGGGVTSAVFRLRFYGGREVKGRASVLSTRGGVLKDKDFIIQTFRNR